MDNFSRISGTLEFNKILQNIAECAPTEGAKERILAIVPSTDTTVVRRLQKETFDAKGLIALKGMPSFGHIVDIVPNVDRAVKDAALSPRELLDIASLLRGVSSLTKYISSKEAENSLTELFSLLRENKFLLDKISNSIISEDMIADTATDQLYNIRRDMRKCESSIRDVLSKYTTGHQSKYLQENIVTMRGGRYVIPVKAEYRNEVKGLLHDTSSSGATLFIEPIAVLELNNKIRERKADEEDEIRRILLALSSEVARFSGMLILNFNVITDLSVIFARAEYSFRIGGSMPKISDECNKIKLIKARHPLLAKDSVVPISLEFGGDVFSLVITGPNTGGKTVTLKTIGLMALMNQSGIQLPCDYGTEISVFSSVLPDIGDEQSIEQSLSTFSSHMVNIVNIIETADDKSLVLLDELGAGTDPEEGAALAVSILEKMKSIGALTAATTHYAELKLYALDTQGVLNASCEFDTETLRPTYRLIVGIPGKSNAFAISLRLGLDASIIERAKELMNEDNKRFEKIIGKLEETESKLEKEKSEAEANKAEVEKLLGEANEKAKKIIESAEKELNKSREQALSMIASAKASSNYIFDLLTKLQKEKEKEEIGKKLDETRKAVREQLKNVDKAFAEISDSTSENDDEYVLPRPLVNGDLVTIKGYNKVGTVILVDAKSATIQMGAAKTKIPLSQVKLAPEREKTKTQIILPTKTEAVKHEIDLRGQTGDDAWYMTDKYLDDAIRSGFTTVSLIHGKGTGALRNALWEYLRGDKRIKSYRIGRYGEGETGVTIVELRERKS